MRIPSVSCLSFKQYLKFMLKKLNVEFLEAENGKNALELVRDKEVDMSLQDIVRGLGIRALQSSSFDLVITDILMPGKDGLTLIKQIRDLDLNVKIIAISGGGGSHNMGILDIAKTFGADMILKKPISTVDLIKIVNNILSE